MVLVEEAQGRRGSEILLSTEPDLELVGTAVTAEDGIELVRRLEPDLVLLEPRVVVLFCTALDLADIADVEPAIDGYLRKDNLADLVDVVRGLLEQRAQPGSA